MLDQARVFLPCLRTDDPDANQSPVLFINDLVEPLAFELSDLLIDGLGSKVGDSLTVRRPDIFNNVCGVTHDAPGLATAQLDPVDRLMLIILTFS